MKLLKTFIKLRSYITRKVIKIFLFNPLCFQCILDRFRNPFSCIGKCSVQIK